MGRARKGATLYAGPSAFDGSRVVVIATGLGRLSANPKTGPMVQTWILLQDVDPVRGVASGADVGICGDCKLRPANTGACYVYVAGPALQVWRSWRAGAYPAIAPAVVGRGKRIRIGSYGDPAAVPVAVWRELTSRAEFWTGYTHAWQRDDVDELGRYCMASVDNEHEREMAQSIGLRTFSVAAAPRRLGPHEVVCPASAEAGHRLTCATCRLCNGNAAPTRAHVVTIVHGPRAGLFPKG